MNKILTISDQEMADDDFLREKVLGDIADRVQPFHKSLVALKELETYLLTLAKKYPDRNVPVGTWRLKELYFLLKQTGGVHLRYNATVKRKTVNLNMWVMRDHELYLAMPRGKLIKEWETQIEPRTDSNAIQ